MLAAAGADLQLCRQAQPPGEERVVQEGRAHLQRGSHAGAVHLGEDVAGQPGSQVGELRLQHLVLQLHVIQLACAGAKHPQLVADDQAKVVFHYSCLPGRL